MTATDVRDPEPDATAHRKARFRSGWEHAYAGRPYGDALAKVTWQNLGWRLGVVFAQLGPTSAAMVDEMYNWCVRQQKEIGKPVSDE